MRKRGRTDRTAVRSNHKRLCFRYRSALFVIARVSSKKKSIKRQNSSFETLRKPQLARYFMSGTLSLRAFSHKILKMHREYIGNGDSCKQWYRATTTTKDDPECFHPNARRETEREETVCVSFFLVQYSCLNQSLHHPTHLGDRKY